MAKNIIPSDHATDTLTADLKRLGFTDYEARIYIQLLRQSPATAYEVSKSSGVPRPNAYSALQGLSQRGAALLVSEHPAKYVAAEPRRLLEDVAQHTRSLCDTLAEQLEQIAPPADDPHVWTVRGDAAVHGKIEAMIRASEESIWIKASDQVIRRHQAALTEAAARGVKLLIILFGEDADEFRFTEETRVYIHEGDGLRMGVADNLFTLAIDEEEMLTASLIDEVSAAHTRNRPMVIMALSLIRHDYYMAEICERFREEIVGAYGPYLRDLRFPSYTEEQKEAFRRKTGMT